MQFLKNLDKIMHSDVILGGQCLNAGIAGLSNWRTQNVFLSLWLELLKITIGHKLLKTCRSQFAKPPLRTI